MKKKDKKKKKGKMKKFWAAFGAALALIFIGIAAIVTGGVLLAAAFAVAGSLAAGTATAMVGLGLVGAGIFLWRSSVVKHATDIWIITIRYIKFATTLDEEGAFSGEIVIP